MSHGTYMAGTANAMALLKVAWKNIFRATFDDLRLSN